MAGGLPPRPLATRPAPNPSHALHPQAGLERFIIPALRRPASRWRPEPAALSRLWCRSRRWPLVTGLAAREAIAAWFDFFLTVPYERSSITRHTDIETTALILAVGIAVTEIAVRERRQHTAAARRAGYLDGITPLPARWPPAPSRSC
jgi:Domain of unknown function (DUF4118)